MSLAINAAPFDADEPTVPLKGGNVLRRKNSNNRTVKNRGDNGAAKISADNINSVLMNIHDSSPSNDEELGEFEPISPPRPMRGGPETESDSDPLANTYLMDNGDSHSSQPYSGNTPDMDKYRQFMPDYTQMYGAGVETDQLVGPMGAQGTAGTSSGPRTGDPVLDKLNHVIHLLEEQQDDKTSHVTEEIILYFLLGVFVIFIVDSFTRLGKYTR
jgi:hypothetical protein